MAIGFRIASQQDPLIAGQSADNTRNEVDETLPDQLRCAGMYHYPLPIARVSRRVTMIMDGGKIQFIELQSIVGGSTPGWVAP